MAVVLGELAGRVFNRMGKATYDGLTEQQLLGEAAKLAVKRRNKLVYRLKLAQMVQAEEESVTAFETRLKPQVKCDSRDCGAEVDYTTEVVLDNLIRGLADEEIKV